MFTNLFIFGSSVTRDITRVNEDRFGVTHHLAGQSFASAFSPALEIPHALKQPADGSLKRTLFGDISSNAGQLMRRWAPQADAIVIDIACEHWGAIPMEGGAYLTHSGDLVSSGLLDRLKHGPRVEFGSKEHFRLFRLGAAKAYRQLDALGLTDRTLVLNTPLATHPVEGGEVPLSKGRTAAEWNEAYPRYYEELARLGFTIGERPHEGLVRSTSDHIWGPAVHHYVDEMYYWWADEIEEFIEPHR